MRADVGRLVEVGERCLANAALSAGLRIIHAPTSGVVMMQVREPVRKERFYLGEVVVTRCEVIINDMRGWAMVAGEDKRSALAAALCDAVSRSTTGEFAELRSAVDALCIETAERLRADESREWSALEPTRVAFEEFE